MSLWNEESSRKQGGPSVDVVITQTTLGDTSQHFDPVSDALAHALTAASVAAQWGLVAQLAAELEARRLAHANVVSISAAPKSRAR